MNLNDPNILCRDHPDYRFRESGHIRPLFSLEGKKCVITGAAGGIGRSTSKAFAELGGDVCLIDIPAKEERLQEICSAIEKEFGVRAIYATGDVSDEESVLNCVEKAAADLGTIDVCHSNAGVVQLDNSPDVDVKEFKRILDINLVGMMLVSRACANIMKRGGHGGSIILTASQSGHIVNCDWKDGDFGYAYHVSKAGVLHLAHSMALDYIKYGIRVNSISPGVVLSGIHDPVPVKLMQSSLGKIPIGHFGYLQDIASTVAFLATDLSAFCVGTDIIVDGGETLY
ncbi:MAG: SDR family oxidoreductase [Lachnospiraceae bacterium]|nr:SDR family oxidoreductase [Lachnospiraceae bacterium]